MRNFRLSTAHMKFPKIFTLVGSFYWKYIKIQLKKHRGAMYHNTEEWCEIWSRTDLLFQKWQEFGVFWIEHLKVSKSCTLIRPFCAKYIMFERKKYRGIILHDTEGWCKTWRKTDLWFEKWHEEFGKFLLEHSKVSQLGLWWDPFIQSRKCTSLKFAEDFNGLFFTKVYNLWAKKVQRRYVW